MAAEERKSTSRGQLRPQITSQGSPLLSQLQIEHGPAGLLGRFFLKAEMDARQRGVWLALASLRDLAIAKARVSPDWASMPMFLPEADAIFDDRAFCILGYDANGEVVATQAARCYEWSSTTLTKESESMRLFYGTGARPKGAHCTLSAPAAHLITGRVVYSGGGWYHPDYRGRELSAIIPRISRALAYTRWLTDFTVSFVEWALVKKGVVERYGYSHVDEKVEFGGVFPTFVFTGALAWMPQEELLEDLKRFLRGDVLSEVDAGIETGGRHKKRLSAAG